MLTADIDIDEGLVAKLFQNQKATDADVFKNV